METDFGILGKLGPSALLVVADAVHKQETGHVLLSHMGVHARKLEKNYFKHVFLAGHPLANKLVVLQHVPQLFQLVLPEVHGQLGPLARVMTLVECVEA
jgi:hypothetical protein